MRSTHWTRSDRLPAHLIARNGDLRIVSGFRALDFWHCDTSALYPCPHGIRRCGKAHATAKPRDVFFDDLVRQTAAGTIVPIQFRAGKTVHRYWVTSTDRDRLDDLDSDDTRLPPERQNTPATGASRNRPTGLRRTRRSPSQGLRPRYAGNARRGVCWCIAGLLAWCVVGSLREAGCMVPEGSSGCELGLCRVR
ncbi:hypothetical protein [Streptomyces sp. NPDC093554]|uniref:hypothetical protein n=1 Tax=Streptomyces sp. NPDC093554 TaxID=3155074 RepID=UPI00344D1E05